MNLSSLVKNPKAILSGQRADKPANIRGEYQKLTYCRVLAADEEKSPPASECSRAWKHLQKNMALVPTGNVNLMSQPVGSADEDDHNDSGQHLQLVDIGGCYIDCRAVTCADFAMFIRAGGYSDFDLWPKEIWPHIPQFVDQSGSAGPRWWRGGRPPRDQLDHPVTGVCWYEADAYSRWVGKSLPTSAQWQRAGTWHANQEGKQNSLKFPWGNLFETRHANLWNSGIGTTVPVDRYYEGCTPNGIFQLIGNTWEWVDGDFVCPGASQLQHNELGEIRGGAFDTYLVSQATCQFRSGQPKLYRGNNVGFRSCISINKIKHAPGKSFDL